MRKSKKKWERLYDKAISMAREGKGSLYDRVKVLVEVAKDNEFVEDMASKNEKPMVFLSKVVEDSFTTFSELQTMLINFPERESWMSGDLRSMRQELIEKMRGKEKKVEEPDNSKIKMSWKARCLEKEREYDTLLETHKQLQKSYKELQKLLVGTRNEWHRTTEESEVNV